MSMGSSLCPAFSTFTKHSPLVFNRNVHAYPFLRNCNCIARGYSQKTVDSNVSVSEAPTRPHSEILRIRESLLSREKTAVEIAEDYLSRLKERETKIKSFLYVSEHALQEAEQLDKMVAAKSPLGPLAGVPFGIKDNLCTLDMPSTGGSKILEGYRPPFDATCVRKMKEAGALAIGKTNLDEFGMGSSTENSAFQVTSNPWDLSKVPGGSSGGSAACVAARQCTCSLGSDTGGSIRQPASFCGVVGLKPSYGRVSRYGLMAFASSLDVVGCFGTSVMDTAILLEVISGQDSLDATSSLLQVPSYSSLLPSIGSLETKPLDGLRIGLIKETVVDGVDSGVVSAIFKAADHLQVLGAKIQEVSLLSFSLGLPAYYILACSEASSNLARYDGIRYGNRAPADDLVSMYGNSRSQGFGQEVKRRILMGTYALSAGYYDAFYKKAQQVRTIVQTDFKNALKDCDLLISPAAPTAAYSIGEKTNDPLAMYAGDLMTVNVNLAGLPALVVPCGFTAGEGQKLPVGLQFIAAAFDEERMLRAGHIFEQTIGDLCFVPPLL
ncbi:hypothetical protein KP509_09G091800 [Ceratopteris richardii]|uniref:Glutamyl-tRNA(Gln) amidotransferase subunit A, chloroplastic/mitochondrial n=1 Tax=Ceratopteris richardii TaxID=49495 RepID=A0A8T2UCS9_CERRI|nr:hypothetical protein KP509_09G091800 [Ceratopteris richardii]KAH7430280.1 hypothetical protein KP509_09G091800 [Ceratopteris richardii]KAH7430281.1 hypothetical protein KP509_09G091800 [Ceratopteris richardii]KAH7430282.1 hypothetical protein KP509_09G091800 [Ceratopteris richardii]KAH7430283.1 hypothetical protein KP509_09G091800 [Ceratopteris richardii]